MMALDPATERAELGLQQEDALGVENRRLDFEPIPDDTGIAHQASLILLVVRGNPRNLITVTGAPEVILFFENRLPREPRLIDLKQKAAEEFVVAVDARAVVAIMVDAMEIVF